MNASGDYRRLARVYRALEYVAFGRDLERTRFALLPALVGCRDILIVGEGDGRFLQRLLRLNPQARVHCLDLSPAMLAQARQRIQSGHDRVRFTAADIRTAGLPSRHYDAVVTCFVLDGFSAEDCAAVIARISAALRPGALWLWADFVLPRAGLSRCRAQIWLTVLFTFFRWQTGLAVQTLPPAENLIIAAGFEPRAARTLQRGLLRSALFSQPGSVTLSS